MGLWFMRVYGGRLFVIGIGIPSGIGKVRIHIPQVFDIPRMEMEHR